MEELNFITVCFTAGVAACAAVIELAEENTYPAGVWLCCLIANINLIIELA